MEDLNLILFDKLRQVDRHMRMGRGPGVMAPPGMPGGPRGGFPAFLRELVLAILSDREEGIRQRELADVFSVSPSTLSAMLDKLEEDGYLERQGDPTDRRATRLLLTDRGRARAAEIKEQHIAMAAHVFRNLDDGDKRTLIGLLDKMLDGGEAE